MGDKTEVVSDTNGTSSNGEHLNEISEKGDDTNGNVDDDYYGKAAEHWEKIEPTIDGMLGMYIVHTVLLFQR